MQLKVNLNISKMHAYLILAFLAIFVIGTYTNLFSEKAVNVVSVEPTTSPVEINATDPEEKFEVNKTTRVNDTATLSLSTGLLNYNYRRPVTITNRGSSLSDFQVLVITDTTTSIFKGKMRPDCGDIRFTNSDKTTKIPYGIEAGCNSANASFWVKVPSIPPGTTTIYMYYGNPSMTYNNNLGKNNTFIFFDDFNYWDRNKWQRYGAGNDASVAVWDGIMHISGTNMQTVRDFSPGIVLTFVNKAGTELNASTGFVPPNYSYSTPTTSNIIRRVSTTTSYHLVYNDGSGKQDTLSNEGDGYTKKSITWATNLAIAEVNSTNSTITTNVPSTALRIGLGEYNSGFGPEVYIDTLYVRKYASPEPTTSVGAEESL